MDQNWFIWILLIICTQIDLYYGQNTADADCNFFNKQCNWTYDQDHWKWVVPNEDSWYLDGPSRVNIHEHYALMKNFTESNQKVDFTSPEFETGYSCFSFEYYFMVDDSGGSTLSLNLELDGKTDELWQMSTIVADMWYVGMVDLNRTTPIKSFKLKFVANAEVGIVALSHFKLSTEKCVRDICDFESNSLCGWTSSGQLSSFTFTRTKALYTSSKADHTVDSPYGHVLHLPNGPRKSVAIFESPRMDSSLGTQCLSFWLRLSSISTHLNVHQIDSPLNQNLWFSNYTHVIPEWVYVQITFTISRSGYLLIEANKIDDNIGTVDIDDIRIKPGECPNPSSCVFGFDVCGWKNTQHHKWRLGTGRVEDASKLKFDRKSTNLPPSLYSDFTANEENKLDKLELVSEYFKPPNKDVCLHLTYNAETFDAKKDLYDLSVVSTDGSYNQLWKFNDSTGTLILEQIYVPNLKKYGLNVRFSIRLQSSSASTYVDIQSFAYYTIFTKCDSHTDPTVKTTTTVEPTVNPKQSLNCDFEHSCLWNDLNKNMKVVTARETKGMYRPFEDHTTKSADGHFVYYVPSMGINGVLQAPNPYKTTICFSFYYFFNTISNALFTLSLMGDEESLEVFRGYNTDFIKWNLAKFEINNTMPYKSFQFVTYLENGVLAIDDILVYEGNCIHDTDMVQFCDYETGKLCLFEPVYNPFDLNWRIIQAQQVSEGMHDHTTNGKNGHFYGMDFSQLNLTNVNKKSFWIITEKLALHKWYFCLRFSYYLENVSPETSLYYGTSYSILEGLHKHWQLSGNTSKLWFTHEETLINLSSHIIIGIDIPNNQEKGKIFIDDVSIVLNKCPDTLLCDFNDGDMCLMENVPLTSNKLVSLIEIYLTKRTNYTEMTDKYLTDYADVSWHVFSPRQSMKYIQHDNTFKTPDGKYVLLIADDEPNRGMFITDRYNMAYRDKLCLQIAVYKPTSESILEVYQGESNDNKMGLKIWDTRHSNTDWTTFEIEASKVHPNSTDIYFYVIGTLLKSDTYIALDDIRIKEFCMNPSNTFPITPTPSTLHPQTTTVNPSTHFFCENSNPIPIEKVCDWHKDCPLGDDEANCGNCVFIEHDSCHYTNISAHSFDDRFKKFSFKFGDEASVQPLPDLRFYVLANGVFKDKAVAYLISPLIHQSYVECTYGFYYSRNVHGFSDKDDSHSMQLYLMLSDLGMSTKVWQSTIVEVGNREWVFVKIGIGRVKHPLKLYFKAYGSTNNISFHAVGDVKMLACESPKPQPDNECVGSFKCSNEVCVPEDVVCDFEDNCGDGSDEMNCDGTLMTSFENGLNRWGEGKKQFWNLLEADTDGDLKVAPTYDHTSGYISGTYLIASSFVQDKYQDVVAVIDSPPFSFILSGCLFRFFIFKNSINSQLLISFHNLNTGEEKFIDELVNTGSFNQFHRNSYRIFGNSHDVYQIHLTAKLNGTEDSFVKPYIAIDDISFSKECKLVDHLPTASPNHTTVKPDNCDTILCQNQEKKTVCLSATQICDFVFDCLDHSDEVYCGNCTFDNNTMCHWENYQNGNYRWELIFPAKKSPFGLPKIDGSNNGDGGFVAVQSSQKKYYIILKSPRINAKTKKTCKFLFDVNSKHSELLVKLNYEMLGSFDPRSDQWKRISIDVGERKPGFNLFLYASTYSLDPKLGGYVDMVVDNLQFVDCLEQNPNDTKPADLSSLTCDFEQSMCGWLVIDTGPKLGWYRTSNIFVEPGIDHTSLKRPQPKLHGTWITSETNLGDEYHTNYFQSAHIIKASKNVNCISFWYYYFGVEMSQFSLFISPDSSTNNLNQLWTRIRPKERNWSQAYVEIEPQSHDYYLVFVARLTSMTIVSIDDVQTYDSACPFVNSEFCDFEVNTCDWSVGNWTRSQGNNSYVDHTTGTTTGHFMFDKQSNQLEMKKPLNTLPVFENTTDQQHLCLAFYYLFDTDGFDGNPLDNSSNVMVKVNTKNSEIIYKAVSILDVYDYDLNKKWTLKTLSFNADKSETLSIIAEVQNKYTRLLIDDVSITEGYCLYNGNCDFENDMCGWENSFSTDMRTFDIMWIRIQANHRFLPTRNLRYDHTTESSKGNYLMLTIIKGKNDQLALLKSPMIRRVTRHICFRMFYFALANSPNTTALKIKFVDLTRASKQTFFEDALKASDDHLSWLQYEHNIGNLPIEYAFEIHYDQQSLISDIGIDDISVIHGTCNGSEIITTTTQEPDTEKVLDCEFEPHKTCNWNFSTSTWKLTNYKQENSFYAPREDHTYQDSNGHYLLFQNTTNDKDFWIITNQTFIYTQNHCLMFWYYYDGEVTNWIRYKSYFSSDYTLFGEFGTTIETRTWNLIKLDIPFNTNYNNTHLTISIGYATDYLKYFSIFAIDDITVKPGECRHADNYVYSFDIGLDDLELENIQPISSDAVFVYSGIDKLISGVPVVDHTTNTINGSYLLFKNQQHMVPTDYITTVAMLNIPGDFRKSCVRFAYQSKGDVTLMVHAEPSDDNSGFIPLSHQLWRKRYNKDHWTVVEANKRIDYDHKIVFYMEKSPDSSSFIALDDLTVLHTDCELMIDCDFENNRYCSYSTFSDSSTTPDYHFSVITTSNDDPMWPGPKTDHTTGGFGGYLFLTGFRSSRNAKKLVSKMVSGARAITDDDSYCLSMWTFINSPDEEMVVYIVRYGHDWQDNNRTLKMVNIGNETQADWTNVFVNLPLSALTGVGEIEVIIEGRLQNVSKLIAIDDIKLTKGACDFDGVICGNGNRVGPSQVCNFVFDCPDGLDEIGCGNCTFEQGVCGWTDTEKEKHGRWQIKSPNTLLNGPRFDADGKNNGHFLTMDKRIDRMEYSEIAINYKIPGMYLKQSYSTCLMQFAYFVNTTSSYSLRIRIGEEILDMNTVYAVASSISSSDTSWHKVVAHIGAKYTDFIVDIQAFQTNPSGVIAIDNLAFTQCALPNPLPPKGKCPSDKSILCPSSRICIGEEDICDMVNDCVDNWDESKCDNYPPACTFDSLDACNLEGFPSQNVYWRVMNGVMNDYDDIPGYEPLIDNTKRTRNSNYFILKERPFIFFRSKLNANFTTPRLASINGEPCKIRFFYFTNGPLVNISQNQLDILAWIDGDTAPLNTPIVRVHGNSQQRWIKMTADYTSSSKPFQFVFMGKLSDKNSRIAIDDISYSKDCKMIPPKPSPTTSTTPSTIRTTVTQSTVTKPGTTTSTTKAPNIKPKSNNVNIIIIGILVPLLIILGIVGGYYGYRKYLKPRNLPEPTVSMKILENKIFE